jgi:hypothetical protein
MKLKYKKILKEWQLDLEHLIDNRGCLPEQMSKSYLAIKKCLEKDLYSVSVDELNSIRDYGVSNLDMLTVELSKLENIVSRSENKVPHTQILTGLKMNKQIVRESQFLIALIDSELQKREASAKS